MAGRNLSRGFLQAFGPPLKRKLYAHRDDGVAAAVDLCGLLANPSLKSLPRNSDRPTDPDGRQLTSRQHCEHLRPPETKEFPHFGGPKQQWFQSQPNLPHAERLPASLRCRRCRTFFG